jgi:pectate lyase
LRSYVMIQEPYLTIAGQTAPGGGIQIRGHGILIQAPAHDIIVRYIRHRRGWEDANGSTDKGFGISSGSSASSPSVGTVYNITIDHSSFGWQQDDNDAWGKVRDITFQWNIYAEGNSPGAFSGIEGKGLLVGTPPEQGSDMGSISIHHNFLTSNYMRNPAIYGDGPTEFVNNVIYNWAEGGAQIQNRGTGTAVNIIGNYFKAGPDTMTDRYEMHVDQAGRFVTVKDEQLPQMMYTRDNFGPHRTNSTQAEWAIVGYCTVEHNCTNPASVSFQRSSPWPPSDYPITVSPAQANVENVLNNVGATLPARDAVDTRLVAEYHAGTGSVGGDNNWPVLAAGTPPADTDRDGMPDQWEISKGLNPNNPADRNDVAPTNSGYTNLEVYLDEIA